MLKLIAAPILALALIAGLVIERWTWPQPEDVEEYHAAVAEAIRAVPTEIGPWRSSEVELPMAAVALLRPNEILSRRYVHEAGDRAFQFLMIHCRDARDMIGHYPPNCYPANGWDMLGADDRAWEQPIGVMPVAGMSYAFERHMAASSAALDVVNLIVLPDGTFGQSMRDVNRIAADRQFRVYGAGQVQFVFTGNFTASERQEVVETFTAAAEPAIQAIRTGVQR